MHTVNVICKGRRQRSINCGPASWVCYELTHARGWTSAAVLVNASVCRSWRKASFSDVIWRRFAADLWVCCLPTDFCSSKQLQFLFARATKHWSVRYFFIRPPRCMYHNVFAIWYVLIRYVTFSYCRSQKSIQRMRKRVRGRYRSSPIAVWDAWHGYKRFREGGCTEKKELNFRILLQLETEGGARKSFFSALKDSKRTLITKEELCSFVWSFRFKRAAGKSWTSTDPYWTGKTDMFLQRCEEDI